MPVLTKLATLGKVLTVGILLSGSDAYSQNYFAVNNRPVIYDQEKQEEQRTTLGNLLQAIEKKYDVSFICRSELLDIKVQSASFNPKGKTFISNLEKLIKPLNLKVQQVSKQQYVIVSTAKKGVSSVPEIPGNEILNTSNNEYFSASPNEKAFLRITGTVRIADGSPLSGVTVSVKGSGIASVTNDLGYYEINVPDKNAILIFSSVGYAALEIPVNDQTSINISMEETTRSLDQVVVVGYGTQKKANLTGAVDAVNGKTLESRPVTSVSSALQGLVPGLTIRSTNPRPGLTGGTIRIRGIGTLGAGADPLLVIDGILQLSPGYMDHLNPDDIENVSVLKDAAAAAIYGARGANGVILITTKKGKADLTPTVGYSYYYGIQTPTAQAEFLGSPDYMRMLNESQENVGRTPTYTEEQIQTAIDGSDPNYFANTNWVKEIFKSSAPQQNHSVNVNGGSGKSGYYLSYNYLNQGGLVVGDAYKADRHNVRLRLNTEVANRFQIDANLSYLERNYSEPISGTSQNGGVIYSAHQISPLVPVRFTSGTWGYGGGSQNPIAIANEAGLNNFGSQQFAGNISGTLRILDGLSVKAQYGVTMENSLRNEQVRTVKYFYPETGDLWYTSNPVNRVESSDYVTRNQNLAIQADFEKKIGSHDLKVLAGYSQEWLRGDFFNASRQGLVTDNLPILNIGTLNQLNGSSAYQRAIQSVFGRLNYSYKGKYLFEINHRLDATSRFAKELRWDGFPSMSAGWRLSEENFMDFIRPFVSSAKIRGSWGRLGNENTGSNYYPYLSVMQSVNTMPIGNVLTSAFAQTTSANPALFWEYVEMSNIGLDLTFLQNRFSLSADYFVKNTKDILATIPLPDVLGVSEPQQNLLSVQNKGWELNIGWNDKINKLSYGLNFNISDVRNKVTDLAGVNPVIGDQVRMVGYPIDAFYGLVAERIAQQDDFTKDPGTNKLIPKFPVMDADKNFVGPGDLIYKDLNNDGAITLTDDRQVIGDPFPRYTYAMRGNLGYKGIDFSFFLQGVGKGNGYILGPARHAFINESTNPQKVHLDRWTPDNPNASYPRLTYQRTYNQRLSTFWLENAAYIRLKNIQVGYTIPANITQRARIQRLRIYASADNLFTKTNFFYAYDPETPLSSGGLYPQVKTYVFGLNLTFK